MTGNPETNPNGDVGAAREQLQAHSDTARGMVDALRRTVKLPYEPETVEFINGKLSEQLAYLAAGSSLDLMIMIVIKNRLLIRGKELDPKQREELEDKGFEALELGGRCLEVSKHYFDPPVADRRRARTTDDVAKDIDTLFSANTTLRDGARSFFGEGHSFFAGLFKASDLSGGAGAESI